MATRYVDPNSTTGGDGTTQLLTGATRAFVSLSEWEAARQGTLSEIEEVICSTNGGAADTTSCTILGWTTDASNYIDIKADPSYRHAGVWNTAKYRLETTSSALDIRQSFTRVTGIQVKVTASSGTPQIGIRIGLSGAPNSCLVDRCILRGVISGTVDNAAGVWTEDGSDHIVRDCLAYDWINIGVTTAAGFRNGSAGTITWQNNTTHNCERGFYREDGTVNATNCGAAASNVGGFSGTITQTTCSSTTPTFVNEAGDDFHLAGGDTTWKSQGTNLSGSFTLDIDGQTITSWPIGADDPAGTSAIPFFTQLGAQRVR